MPDDIAPARNEAEHRYELRLAGDLVGSITYAVSGDVVELTHTVVDSAHAGRGYAGTLARFALDDISERGLRVRPTCSYVKSYLERHPQYAALVAAD